VVFLSEIFALAFRIYTVFELQQPIRWAQGCPLEKMVSEALVFDDETHPYTTRQYVISALNRRYGKAIQKRR